MVLRLIPSFSSQASREEACATAQQLRSGQQPYSYAILEPSYLDLKHIYPLSAL